MSDLNEIRRKRMELLADLAADGGEKEQLMGNIVRVGGVLMDAIELGTAKSREDIRAMPEFEELRGLIRQLSNYDWAPEHQLVIDRIHTRFIQIQGS